MIEINLLPVSLRKKKGKFEISPLTIMAIGVGMLLLLLLVSFGLAIGSGVRKTRLRRMKAAIKQLRPESEKVARLKGEKEKLNKRMSIIEQLMDKRILWAKKMNQLSNLIPPQTWLISLAVEEISEEVGSGSGEEGTKEITRRFLILKGSATSKTGERSGELKLVGDFMDKLRNDSSFYEDFVNVRQRGPISWGESGGAEAMFFELSCQFKEGK